MMFDVMTFLFPLVFFLVFFLILAIFIVTFVRSIRTWHSNNQSPRLTVLATVVAKRQNVTHHDRPIGGDASGAHGFSTTYDTSYYVTFQVESGDRMEFHVPGNEYGLLAEGDAGRLSFQGTRYLSFERNRAC